MTVITIGELLMEASQLLEEASIIDSETEYPLEIQSFEGKQLAAVHAAKTQAATYLVLKSQAYSQLALARMQYESGTAV